MNKLEVNKFIEEIKIDEKSIRTICNNINELDLIDAKYVYEKLIEFTNENNFIYAYSWILHYSGWVFHDLGEFDKAIKMHKEACKLFDEYDNNEGVATAVNALVANFSMKKNFDIAIEYGIQGIEIAERIGDLYILSIIKSNIALIYIEMEQYDKAKELIKQIMSLPNIGNPMNEIANLVNLSECERETSNYDKGLEYLHKALSLANKHDKKLSAHILDQIARIYIKEGLYDVADEFFKESVMLATSNELNLYFYEALVYWTDLDLIINRYDEAIKRLLSVINNKENIDYTKYMKKIYRNLSLAYKGIENYKEAYYYLQEYNSICNSEYENKNKTNINRLDKKAAEEEEKVYKLLYEQTRAIYKLGQSITANLNKADIYNIIAREIKNLIPYDIVQIGVIKNNYIEYQLCLEQDQRIERKPTCLNDESFGAYAVKNNQKILVNDYDKEIYRYITNVDSYSVRNTARQDINFEEYTKSMIFVPIESNGAVIGVLSTQSYKKNMYTLKDITTLKILTTYIAIALENIRLYKEIEYNANYDALTKISNRRIALTSLHNLYVNAKRNNMKSYVLMLDIDNFKKINDKFGHLVGDRVLVEVSRVIKENLSEEDILGRYGGEEFIAVIKNNSKMHLDITEKIRSEIEKIIIDNYKELKVTVSIGITYLDAKNMALNEIISKADKALYKAKNTGKNKVVIL